MAYVEKINPPYYAQWHFPNIGTQYHKGKFHRQSYWKCIWAHVKWWLIHKEDELRFERYSVRWVYGPSSSLLTSSMCLTAVIQSNKEIIEWSHAPFDKVNDDNSCCPPNELMSSHESSSLHNVGRSFFSSCATTYSLNTSCQHPWRN